MSIAERPVEERTSSLGLVSVDDYLAAELDGQVRHEYVGGMVYEMTGATNLHIRIAGNIHGMLYVRQRGKPCQPCYADTKIRIRQPIEDRYYYPDVCVVCRPAAPHEAYQDQPVILVEVLSRSTRRTDLGEKKDAYLTIPSLSVYLLVEQERAAVIAFRRTDQGFVREVYQGLDSIVPLKEIETELPLKEIYEAVEFVPESNPAE